jgi:hypothetical protein
MNVWQDAVKANQAGSASQAQKGLLNRGHHSSY